MMWNRKIWNVLVCMAVMLVLPSCSELWNRSDDDYDQVNYTLAVILPQSENRNHDFENLADWALESFYRAQKGQKRQIKIDLEWYDEDTEDLDRLARVLRMRDDVKAVIGPFTSTDAEIISKRFLSMNKTMIAPCLTSADLIRSNTGTDFFWTLCEPDITQCEVLLTRAISNGANSVSLLAVDDIYGNTFVDWFAFQATELGINVGDVITYRSDGSDLPDALCNAFEIEHDALICVPGNLGDAKVMLEAKRDNGEGSPWMLFSDQAFTDGLLRLGELSDYIEGVSPCTDPESGFDKAFEVHFGKPVIQNGSMIYDSFILACSALAILDQGLAPDMNEAMKMLVRSQDSEGNALQSLQIWHSAGLSKLISAIRNGSQPYDIRSASGTLDFDKEDLTSVTQSVYSHWMVYNGKFVHLNYLTSDGGRRTEPSLGAWNWIPSVSQSFDENIEFSYGPVEDNWAVLVAGSRGWENYRHQADVLNFYQILKYLGYSDDHIILIQDDDMAYNLFNPSKGSVKRYDGQELYVDVQTDYHISDLTPEDIENIFLGNKTEKLDKVLETSDGSNVLVFWSGHGVPGAFLLEARPKEQGFTTAHMEHMLSAMSEKGRFRKMLWFVETCYSASVGVAAESAKIPGCMFITAAGAKETSKADIKIDGIYRTNRFTEILTGVLEQKIDICYRDLCYYLSRYTIGSHVTVLNSSRFDNLFKSSPEEFLMIKK